MNSYCFIYNPAANPATSIKQFDRLKWMTSGWEDTQFLTSRRKGDIRSLARKAAEQFSVVTACGGDGTAREVATGVMNSDAAMAVIPMGTGNDFSKSLNVPGSLSKALEIIRNGHSMKMDMGRCNDIYFINSLGMGFDGLANYYALQSKWKGNWKYVLGALKANLNQEPLQVTLSHGGQSHSESLLMLTLANGRVEGGNFIVAPNARFDDGLLDIVTIRPVSKWILPFLIPLFLRGRQTLIKQFNTFRTANLRIRLDRPAYIHADGEIVDSPETEFEVEVLPSVLNVIGDFQQP